VTGRRNHAANGVPDPRSPAQRGLQAYTTRRIGGVEYGYTQEITELNPPGSWAVRGVDGPFRPSADITVEPLDGGTRSRVTFALDFQGRGIAKLLTLDVIRRIALKQAPRSYRNLKERLERGIGAPWVRLGRPVRGSGGRVSRPDGHDPQGR
jgi:hypothetical protein